MKQKILVMASKPNNLETFNCMLILANTLYERTGKHYEVEVNFKFDSVDLLVVEDK